MSAIYLMHPKHGVKIATMEMEAQYDENNGWVRFDPDAPSEHPSDDGNDALDLPDQSDEVNVMSEAPRRRGRPRAPKDE